ncbi:MAG: diaminopimelate epimerase [Culturomica sp.]|jgi:diaminopimelate epimerase|nr:diaminopimelate epimerase [Culturomica sp.]
MIFTKMQGAGNDYVYFYGVAPQYHKPEFIRRISDRHYGVGSDGLINIEPGKTGDFRMIMFNADGSRSAMCGNGIRCVGKYVYDKGLTTKTEIDIETDAGMKHLTLYPENGKVTKVKVDMGEPVLSAKNIPVNIDAEKVVDYPLQLDNGDTFRITCVSMGNPHAIMFVGNPEIFPIEEIGNIIENHPLFPERTNVEFISILAPDCIRMRVWERGTGETMACGTGACASLVAAVINGKAERKVTVVLNGGNLEIEWAADDNHVYMTGPAETVFEGEYPDNV